MKKLRVIVANDHSLVSAAIQTFLEACLDMEVQGNGRIGPETRKLISRKKPDLLFLYLGMRGYEALQETERLLKSFPKLPTIMLTVNNSNEYVARALRTGVKAILPPAVELKELKSAVRAVTRGATYISPKLPKPGPNQPFERLTPRQQSVLKLMAEGNSTKEIAKILKLSAKTVEFHRARLMERLDIYDVPGLVRLAARAGLVSIDR